MVIDSTFAYHFVDLDLRVEIFFDKERLTENGSVDFEIGDVSTFAHFTKFHAEPVCFFYCFLVTKKQLLKALLTCTFIPSLLNSFDLRSYRSESREKIHIAAVVDASRGAGGKVFLFSWKRLGGGLQKTIVTSKAVPKVLNMKYRSEFKHGFTNPACLHCAILKALHGFKEKEPTRQATCNFSFKMFKMRFSRF